MSQDVIEVSAHPAAARGARRGKQPAAIGHKAPEQQHALLAHLPAEERRLFRRFGFGPVVSLPYTRIHHAFEAWAALTPDVVAAEHLGESITYAQLDRQANRLAALLARRGVRPGDNVALFAQRSIPMLVGLLATLKAGAAYVPQDARICPQTHLRHIVTTASTKVILTLSRFADATPVPEGHSCIAVDALMAEPMRDGEYTFFEPEDAVRAEHGCYVLFTSGTTGQPNGVTVTHRNICNILLSEPGGLGIRPGWRVGQILNIGFDMAAWEILGCLSHGGTLVIRGESIAETAQRVQVLIATPTILSALDPADCHGLKVAAVAGEPCPRTLADRWARICEFYNSCGPTETTIVNTMQRHDPRAPLLSIGRPTPNNTVYVLDEQRRPCRIGEVGEMWAGGDCVSAGYVGNPQLTGERYAPDPFLGAGRLMFRTRDLGRWTRDGELEHLGRTDDQVKIRGFRVELDAVSAALESVPGCLRAATLKLDSRTLIAFVAPGDVDGEEARRAVRRALPYYCVPAAVYALPELPVTSRGKIDKAALLETVVNVPGAEQVATA
ncbi:MAG TPA: amino acid adenylation domain-containing protein [Actinocrinis sp.]|nr:amino acid adenylation domain-containing protein [Actinocrinis sp.]